MPEHLDLLVNRSVLFDIGIALRHIGLGLVIVVIGDEVHDRVMGKELLELACQLGRERLIRRHDKRRLAQRFDSLRHGVGLSRTSHTKKDLIAVPALHTFYERGDGLRLVARRLKGAHNLEARRFARRPESTQLAADALNLERTHETSSNWLPHILGAAG